MTQDEYRRSLLASLLEFSTPLQDLRTKLAAVPWDSSEELSVLQTRHVEAILTRYLAGELSSNAVEEWANAVEGREDIGFEVGHESVLKAAIFALANPALEGHLNSAMAKEWLGRL